MAERVVILNILYSLFPVLTKVFIKDKAHKPSGNLNLAIFGLINVGAIIFILV